MKKLEAKLWKIVEVAKSGDLNEISVKYLEDGFGKLFIKYVYDKDMDFLKFVTTLEDDVKNSRINLIELYENLYKIYYFHRDLDSAIEFKESEIKLKAKAKQDISKDYYEVANVYYDKGELGVALEKLKGFFKNTDTTRLTLEKLDLYIKSLIMQNQLKQDLKFPKDEVLADLKSLDEVFKKVRTYFKEPERLSFVVQILYLYSNHYLSQGEYKVAIKYGQKAKELLTQNQVAIKISLKYRIYESLAYAYLLDKDYERAVDVAKSALKLKNTLLTIDVFSVLTILSEAYLGLGDPDEALNYAHEANGLVNNSFIKLEYIYELLAKIYKAKDDEKSTTEYLQKLCKLQEAVKKS